MMERSNQYKRRKPAPKRRGSARGNALSSDNILKTAYILAGLIITAVLVMVLLAVVTGSGQMRNTVQAAGSLDYAANDMYVWEGEGLPAADAFLNDSTRSLVREARYLLAPDTAAGKQNIAILMQLEDGTTRTENAVLYIREPVIHWEIGTEATITDLLGSKYADAVLSEPLSNFTEIGTYPVTVTIRDKALPFSLVAEDTQPPVVTLKENLNFYLNQKLTFEDFIADCSDISEVEYHFSENPMTITEGEKQLQLIATDAAGNSATYDLAYTVSGDGLPPEIKGLEKMQTIMGLQTDCLYNVTAEDENDGEVEVTAELPGNFNIRTAGTYTVKYTAKDKSGNTAEETSQLIVLPSLDDVDDLTEDDVLRIGNYLIRELEEDHDSSDRKAFAKAIFDCVQRHVTYYDTHNDEDWEHAAVCALYNGFGDCRSYYAVSRLLLTCGGFENMEVEKVKNYEGDSAHFWNLVKVNGAWYHFDATPRVNSDGFFLYTDDQLDKFSAWNGNCFNRDKSLYPATPTS